MPVDFLAVAQAGQNLIPDIRQQLMQDDERRAMNEQRAVLNEQRRVATEVAQEKQARLKQLQTGLNEAVLSNKPHAITRLPSESMAMEGDAAKERIAQLASEPTDAMLQGAEDYARYLTFQSKLGPTAQSISNISNQNMIAKLFLPFVRTPTNLLKFAAERSPAAPAMAEWRRDFMAGGARRDLALAKMLIGSGFGAAMYEGALNGYVRGAERAQRLVSSTI